MKTLILMPALYHGGAETQFRYLFENLEDCYITALDKSKSKKANDFKQKHSKRIIELRNFFHNKFLHAIQTYLNIIIALLSFKVKFKGKNLLIIYGAGTKWLILYPLIRSLNYKILYSERNDGHHRVKLLYNIIERCDIVTTNSCEAKEIISQFIKNKPIFIINNGIRIPKYKYLKYCAHSPFKILVPARIHELKNQIIIIEALKDMSNVEVHFAGQIDSSYYFDILCRKIKENNCSKSFVFDGYVDNINIYYKEFDLIVLPSFSEGTPNVILESMALQIPCIASNIRMNARIIRNKQLLFNPNSTESVYKCLSYFQSLNSKEIDELIYNNYKYVKNNYSMEEMIDSFRFHIKSVDVP